jgi:cell fate (sporulation/competence/biofilm development) regulator YmcA (YheA/YmcA/DUF963 family)
MKTKSNWEKEFDKRFENFIDWSIVCGTKQPDELKSFICSLLSSQNQSLKKKVEGMKMKDEDTTVYTDFGRMDAYNQAIQDILKLLEE